MEWRVIEGFENYEVSDAGDVRRGDVVLKCTVQIRPCGYKQIRVGLRRDEKRKLFLVSRLVAKAFLPNPDNLPEVDHIDRNSQNNNVTNLRWATRHTQNMNKHHALGESGLRHIRKRINIWEVQIKRHKHWVFRKTFDTLEEAIQARDNYLAAE
jgi:hypothetical protein